MIERWSKRRRAAYAALAPEERLENAARRRELTGYVILVVILAGFVFFAAWGSSRRTSDLLQLACGNSIGHHDLTEAVRTLASQDDDVHDRIARELGLPINFDPIVIHVPAIPPECEGVKI